LSDGVADGKVFSDKNNALASAVGLAVGLVSSTDTPMLVRLGLRYDLVGIESSH